MSTEDLIAFADEAQFAGWSDSHTSGAKVTFWLSSENLEYFRGLTTRKGGKAGQRFYMTLVEMADDEKPVNQVQRQRVEEGVKGGPVSIYAARLCRDTEFQKWTGVSDEKDARGYILRICGINSRRELDHDAAAAQRFETLVKSPFIRWREGRE